MPEAVIVATARSPIGRAFKGSLTTIRPDDLTGQLITAALAKVPAARPGRHRRPDAGLRPARRRAGLQHGPGGRRHARLRQPARHHDHPVLLLVAADHPDGVPRHQGRRGRRVRLRRAWSASAGSRHGSSDSWPDTQQPGLRRARRRARRSASDAGAPVWHDPREDGAIPDIYIAMGQTAENVAQLRGITRAEQDEFGVRSQNLAEKALANGFWQRDITPVTLPDGTVVSRRRRPAGRAPPWRRWPRCSRCSGPTARSPRATAARSTTARPRSWS